MSVLNKILLPNLRFNKRPIMRNTVIYGHALLLILGIGLIEAVRKQ